MVGNNLSSNLHNMRCTPFFHISLLTLLIYSCNQASTSEQHYTGSGQPVISESHPSLDTSKNDIAFHIKLVPMEIVDSSSNNVYKKYGISTSGMCYECDLANISIANGKIRFSNICDSSNIRSYDIISLEQIGQTTEFRFTDDVLVMEKINPGPVYRLQLKNALKPGERLKIKKYYSKEEDIPKFEIHDCGDFGG